jgi:hypothetical protein
LRAESRLLGVVGLDGCVVVETKDAVLVVPKSRTQDVKALVDELRRRQRPEATVGREVFRPWGSYDSVESGAGFQFKRLAVLPWAVLSLQLHHRRAEHWVVVRVSHESRVTMRSSTWCVSTRLFGRLRQIENPGNELLQIHRSADGVTFRTISSLRGQVRPARADGLFARV